MQNNILNRLPVTVLSGFLGTGKTNMNDPFLPWEEMH